MKGLDFGTSTSLVAESTAARAAVTPIGRTEKWLPSLLGRDGPTWLAGDDAVTMPEEQIIRSAKRAITHRRETFTVFDGAKDVSVPADEVLVEILRELVTVAEHEFVPLDDATQVRLGCPAMWEGDQRSRLVRLAKSAGIAVEENSVVDEPVAAGVAWVTRQVRRGKYVRGKLVVFDMGGGTLDVAVLSVDAGPGEPVSVSVQSAVGVDQAGDTLDGAIERDFIRKLAKLKLNVATHPKGAELAGWIRRAAREAKVQLSASQETTVVVNHPSIDVPSFDYTRQELETAFAPQLEAAISVIWWALRSALMAQVKSPTQHQSLRPSQARGLSEEVLAEGVNYVVLAGGMAHVPRVRERMAEIFGPDRVWVGVEEGSVRSGSDSTEMIALGLAFHDVYDRMNLHRPGFDFVLRWLDPRTGEQSERTVYEAYKPLYTQHDVWNTDMTKYSWKPRRDELPTTGEGVISVRAANGEHLGFRANGTEVEGIRFEFGHGTPVVTLEPNGRVFWRDGAGRDGAVRVARWPVIRGMGQESLVIEETKEEQDPRWSVDSLPWHLKPYD